MCYVCAQMVPLLPAVLGTSAKIGRIQQQCVVCVVCAHMWCLFCCVYCEKSANCDKYNSVLHVLYVSYVRTGGVLHDLSYLSVGRLQRDGFHLLLHVGEKPVNCGASYGINCTSSS